MVSRSYASCSGRCTLSEYPEMDFSEDFHWGPMEGYQANDPFIRKPLKSSTTSALAPKATLQKNPIAL